MFLLLLDKLLVMPTKYDVFYLIAVNKECSINDLIKLLNKKPSEYHKFFKHVKQLEKEFLITKKEKKYLISADKKSNELAKLIHFCVNNKIDYNSLFLDSSIKFIKIGLEKNLIKEFPFDNKTVKKITSMLVKHGFIIIESKKPLKIRIVYSDFLEKLAKYFEGEIKIDEKNIFEEIDIEKLSNSLEKEFSLYKKQNKKQFLENETEFIHRSLSLEGNTLTLPETEKLIIKNIVPKNKNFKELEEIRDYKKAIDILIQKNEMLDLETILEFHKTAMNWMTKGAGEIRKQNVKIKGNPDFKTDDYKIIPIKLKNFFEYYNSQINKKRKSFQIIELAAFLHNEFQRMHPFIDGNSRTSRAVFIHTLMLKEFPLISFSAGFIYQYMQLTKLSKKRNDENFQTLMKQMRI